MKPPLTPTLQNSPLSIKSGNSKRKKCARRFLGSYITYMTVQRTRISCLHEQPIHQKITSICTFKSLIFAGANGKLNRGQRRRRADSTEGFLTTDHFVFVSKLYLYFCYPHICISKHHTVQKVFSSVISLYLGQSCICICLTIVIQLGLNLHNFSLGAEGEWRLGGADETRWFFFFFK